MRLLHLSPYLPHPPRHGGRMRTRQLLRAAAEAGFEVVLVALAADQEEAARADGLRSEGFDVRTAIRTPAADRLSGAERLSKWARVLTGRSSLLPRWSSDAALEVVRGAAAEKPFDLAVVDTPWVDSFRAALPKTPYVASTQNVESDVLLAAADGLSGPAVWAGRRDAAALRRFESGWVRRAAAVVAVSEEDAARFALFAHGARTVVVPNAVELERLLQLPPAPKDGGLLFVGSFDYPPNAEAARRFVSDFLPAVRKTAGPVACVLAGRAPNAEMRALDGRDGTTVVADPEDLAPLYAAAAAVVVPLRVGGGSRIKILEAFAFGRPVISTAAGASGLAVKNGRELLIADDGAAFGAALSRLRNEAGLAETLVANARRFVAAHHDWTTARRIYGAALIAALRT